MLSFIELSKRFEEKFNIRHFPEQPETLYNPAQYILGIGGKRIRPVCVLMGNQLFDEIDPDAYNAAAAIELFHNFSLIHDDIMDKAPIRRGMETVHTKYGATPLTLKKIKISLSKSSVWAVIDDEIIKISPKSILVFFSKFMIVLF